MESHIIIAESRVDVKPPADFFETILGNRNGRRKDRNAGFSQLCARRNPLFPENQLNHGRQRGGKDKPFGGRLFLLYRKIPAREGQGAHRLRQARGKASSEGKKRLRGSGSRHTPLQKGEQERPFKRRFGQAHGGASRQYRRGLFLPGRAQAHKGRAAVPPQIS